MPSVALLGAIRYAPNRAVLHTDAALLPRSIRPSGRRGTTCRAPRKLDLRPVSVSYLINRLQPLPFKTPLMVSLNPQREPQPARVIAEFDYAHPILMVRRSPPKRELPTISGDSGVWFCGAWNGYGFHEDGLKSALQVANALACRAPWQGLAALCTSGSRLCRSRRSSRMNNSPARLFFGQVMHPPAAAGSQPLRLSGLFLPAAALQSSNRQRARCSRSTAGICSASILRITAPVTDRIRCPGYAILLQREGIRADGEVWLQCFPRVLGFVFNPISLWFCHDRAGKLIAVLAEVNNTFGERHNYLLTHADGRPIRDGETIERRKVFHVSPFMAVDGHYRFRFHARSGEEGLPVWRWRASTMAMRQAICCTPRFPATLEPLTTAPC
jgi:hypothetical protein